MFYIMAKKQISHITKSIKNTTVFILIASIGNIIKKNLPPLPKNLFNICIGMILGDGSLFKKSHHSGIKFEQGYKQKEFLYHLFDLFSLYTFMDVPGQRIDLHSKRKGLVKSFWFKTFSHYSFTELWHLFRRNEKKEISENLITDYLTPIGFAYWIMCDGSLQKSKNCLIIHTQSFTKLENLLAAKQLNNKWGLRCEVILHKQKYWVIKTHVKDVETVHFLLKPYLIPSMIYKLPEIKKNHTIIIADKNCVFVDTF